MHLRGFYLCKLRFCYRLYLSTWRGMCPSVCTTSLDLYPPYLCIVAVWVPVWRYSGYVVFSGWPLALTRVSLWWTQSPTNASTSSATSPASCVSNPLYTYPFCISFNHSLPAYVADLAKQEIRRGSTPATFSPKPTVMKHASVRSMSTQQFRVIFLCHVSTSFTLL